MLKSHYHCLYKVTYHLVLLTKDQKNCFNEDMLVRLNEITHELCDKADIKLVEFNAGSDHVYLLLEAHPNVMPSRFVNSLKTVTSRFMRKEFGGELAKFYSEKVLWARGYCLLTSGDVSDKTIADYIGKNTNRLNKDSSASE